MMVPRKMPASILKQIVLLLMAVSVALAAMDLPEKLRDVPLYPDSKIEQTMDMESHVMATMKVHTRQEAILDFYKKTLEARGWKVVFQAQQEDSSMIHFQNDKKMLQLVVQSDNQEGTITYSLIMANSRP